MRVCSCLCEFGGGAEQVGGGHSLNEWGKVGVEIVLFFVWSLSLAWIQGRIVFWGLELGDRPMTVCVCVSCTKLCRGWCAFGKGLCACMYRRAGVLECICAYVSVCSLYMFFFFFTA